MDLAEQAPLHLSAGRQMKMGRHHSLKQNGDCYLVYCPRIVPVLSRLADRGRCFKGEMIAAAGCFYPWR